MRAILLAALSASALPLGACASTSTQSAEMNSPRIVEVAGGQSRYSVDVNQPVQSDVTSSDQSYSLTGENTGEKVPQRVNIPAYVRQATNGGN